MVLCEYFYNFSHKITNVFKQENHEFCKDKKILVSVGTCIIGNSLCEILVYDCVQLVVARLDTHQEEIQDQHLRWIGKLTR